MSTMKEVKEVKEKHGRLITAKTAEDFEKADKICQHIFDTIGPRGMSMFRSCDTSWIGHQIIKFSSDNFSNEKGYWIPMGNVNISTQETDTSIEVRVYYPDERFTVVLSYPSQFVKLTNKFVSEKLFDPKVIEQILNPKKS